MPGISKLVRVHCREVVARDDTALLTLRWEATGHGGGMFPALDADITLAPAGEDATRLTLVGAYRPPLAALGAGLDRRILHRVATATVHTLMSHVADAIVRPEFAPEAYRDHVIGTRPARTAEPDLA
jgi:carbon monoxide dehydrogenase subunit G